HTIYALFIKEIKKMVQISQNKIVSRIENCKEKCKWHDFSDVIEIRMNIYRAKWNSKIVVLKKLQEFERIRKTGVLKALTHDIQHPNIVRFYAITNGE
ncbi:5674_t:CDS:1, partial [Cetraspora pellucida]